jgi:hypothetical protein
MHMMAMQDALKWIKKHNKRNLKTSKAFAFEWRWSHGHSVWLEASCIPGMYVEIAQLHNLSDKSWVLHQIDLESQNF